MYTNKDQFIHFYQSLTLEATDIVSKDQTIIFLNNPIYIVNR